MPITINHSHPARILFGQLRHRQTPQARDEGISKESNGSTQLRFGADKFQYSATAKNLQPVQFGGRLSKFTKLSEVPATQRGKDLDAYSEPLAAGDAKFLSFRRTNSGWEFVARPNVEGVIHNVVIVRDDNKRQTPYVVLNVTHSAVFGGRPKIMLPAGLWDDKNAEETFSECAQREVQEETGLQNIRVNPLAGETEFVASGGITTERKGFALCVAEGTPNLRHLDEGETIDRHYLVPLSTFLNGNRFGQWINEITQKGYLIEADIPIARAFMSKKLIDKSLLAFTA